MPPSPLADLLACPACSSALAPSDALLRCSSCAREYPVVGGIPRFVPAENYADGFGVQWNRFATTQLDSHSGLRISSQRFYRTTGWSREELAGKRVLDVGCGAGRFAEIALEAGPDVVALDYSSAVDACKRNLGANDRLLVVQGDVYHLPMRAQQFDYVYCLGVLQHTPDVGAAFLALAPMLRAGGAVAIDLYPKLLRNVLWSKYWLRPVTKHLPSTVLFPLVENMVKWLLPISRVVGRIPALGRQLRYAIPIANYEGVYPLNEAQLREWSVLDTFDMLAPAHDQPQSADTLRSWFREADLDDVEVFRDGFLIGRDRRARV